MAKEIFNSPILPGVPVEKHEHLRLSIILIGAIILIVVILGLYYFNVIPAVSTTTTTPATVGQMDKSTLLSIAKQASTTPLDNSEKQAIFENIKGAKAQQYNLTKEEQASILRALNK
jgi:hypothetical protein